MATVFGVTSMLTWQADGEPGLEGVRLVPHGGGFRALGRMVRTGFTASYRLIVGDDGIVERVSITAATPARERHLTLNRSEDGVWLTDSGSGSAQRGFVGALDVDLAHSPMFNALPIRRLGLHRDGGDEQLPVVFVSLPDLRVELVEQRYRTVSTLDDAGRAVVGFVWGSFGADIEVDADGLVLAYPGVATRVAAPVAATG